MTLPRISPKRKKTVKLGFNSTFSVKPKAPKQLVTITEMREQGLLKRATDLAKGPKVKTGKQKWKAKAWKQFSLFIRLRDADANGIVTCCTCGSRRPWKQVQAGHYVTRAKEATLFDEQCVQGQCAGCNMWQGGKPLEFEQHLERRYGPGTAQALRTKAMVPCRRTESDYKFLAETYKARVDLIKETEPNKYHRQV